MDSVIDKMARLPREDVVFALCALLLIAWLTPRASAQASLSALPSLYRMPWLEVPTQRLRLSLSGGYGVFEGILNQGDLHHRVLGSFGGALMLRSGLAFELRGDGRTDIHVLRGEDDRGSVLEPRLAARYVRPLNDRYRVAGQVSAWVPGAEFPAPDLRATTVDVEGSFGAKLGERVDLSTLVGYRFDRSARAVEHPEQLSPSDFMALGLSDFDAVLVGFGVRFPHGGKDATFTEISADVFVGDHAPDFTEMPMRASVGVDQAINQYGTRVRAALSASLAARPRIDVDGPLMPLEPRAWLLFALTQDTLEERAQVREVPAAVAPAPEPVPALEPMTALPVDSLLRVVVRDIDFGDPLEATITANTPGVAKAAATGESTRSSEGMIELSIEPGRYEVLIEAKGYVSQRRVVNVEEGGVTVLNVDLKPREER